MEDKVDSAMRGLLRFGSSPYVMLTRNGFVARIGIAGRFVSASGDTAVAALEKLMTVLESGRHEAKEFHK